jgi:hypothetical protein
VYTFSITGPLRAKNNPLDQACCFEPLTPNQADQDERGARENNPAAEKYR